MVIPYRGYVDDSGRGQGSVFVLAGFMAPVDQWATFWKEWEAALAGPPKLDYFKMKEAAACRGQFEGWSDTSRDERLRTFIDIIDRNVTAGMASIVDQSAYRDVFKGRIGPGVDSPYFLNFYAIMQVAMEFQLQAKTNQPIEFIFDEQGREIGRALRGWKGFMQSAPPWAKEMLSQPPISGDEKKVIPLQAADLLAWRVRRALGEPDGLAEVERLLPFPESLKIQYWAWDRRRLQEQYSRIRAVKGASRAVFPYELNRKDRRRVEKMIAKGEKP